MLRIILVLIIVSLFLILFLPILLLLALIRLFRPDVSEHIAFLLVRNVFRLILRVSGTKIQVIGRESIPEKQGLLYVGNHRSIFDILILYVLFPSSTPFVAKDSLKKVPILPFWMTMIGCLFLDRKDLKAGMQMIRKASSRIKEGKSICIFPEGTRSKNDADVPLLDFHEGSFRVATMAGSPIVPVAINNSHSILSMKPLFIRPSRIIVEFGDPIVTAALARSDKKRLGTRSREIITEMLVKNARLLEKTL